MSDNTIQLKVSVDTSELDKLEEQLNRIKQLMQDVGVKPKSIPPFFFQSSGEFFLLKMPLLILLNSKVCLSVISQSMTSMLSLQIYVCELIDKMQVSMS